MLRTSKILVFCGLFASILYLSYRIISGTTAYQNGGLHIAQNDVSTQAPDIAADPPPDSAKNIADPGFTPEPISIRDIDASKFTDIAHLIEPSAKALLDLNLNYRVFELKGKGVDIVPLPDNKQSLLVWVLRPQTLRLTDKRCAATINVTVADASMRSLESAQLSERRPSYDLQSDQARLVRLQLSKESGNNWFCNMRLDTK